VGTHLDPFAADLDDTERDALIIAVDHWMQFAPRWLPSIDGVLERPQWRARRYGWDWPSAAGVSELLNGGSSRLQGVANAGANMAADVRPIQPP
jgi:hypothetical protein